jgi:peptide/nickel transport system permease protein
MAIVLLVTGLTLVGEGLNETLNPTLRKRRLTRIVAPKRERTEQEATR